MCIGMQIYLPERPLSETPRSFLMSAAKCEVSPWKGMGHRDEQHENKLVSEGDQDWKTTGLELILRVAKPQSGTWGLGWGAMSTIIPVLQLAKCHETNTRPSWDYYIKSWKGFLPNVGKVSSNDHAMSIKKYNGANSFLKEQEIAFLHIAYRINSIKYDKSIICYVVRISQPWWNVTTHNAILSLVILQNMKWSFTNSAISLPRLKRYDFDIAHV